MLSTPTDAIASAERLIAAGNRAEDEGRLADAREQYRAAVAAAPGYAKGHLNLGIAMEAAGDIDGALKAYETALTLDQTGAYAAYNLGNLLYRRGDLGRAAELLRCALERKPDFPEADTVLGNVYASQGNFPAAAAAFEAALERQPDSIAALHGYAGVLARLERWAEAETVLRRTAAAASDNVDIMSFLAHVLVRQGRLGEAVSWYQKALAINPRFADALSDLGNVYCALGRTTEAAQCYRDAIAVRPELPEAYCNLGNILLDEGKLDDALALYERALALNPSFVEARHNLCMILHQRGRAADAIACLREVLALNPDFAKGYLSLARFLNGEKRSDEAVGCLQKALSLNPALADAHVGLGGIYADRGQNDEALRCYRKAVSLDPENVQARWSAAFAHLPAVYEADSDPASHRRAFAAQLEELGAWIDAGRRGKSAAVAGSLTPFYLAYQEESNRELLRRHGDLCARVMSEWFDRRHAARRDDPRHPGSVVRVGVVSHHFQNHSVWNAIVKGWFQALDRAQFSVEAFYLGTVEDQETRLAQSLATHFHQGRKSLDGWVETILERRLDVLIYPEIGMDPMTVKLASLRLAPVQAAAWGHPDTTGLPTMDYYLSAEDLEPDGAAANYTERLVMLPHLGCYYPALKVAPVAPDLHRLDIDPTVPILLCPGTPFKYAPEHDVVFAEIARRLERCQLVFFARHPLELAEKLRARLRIVLGRSGIDADRVTRFIPWQNTAEFYGLMGSAAVFLDTIGFSGFNTAMQAVECGLPIVTREGRFMRGRLASGILKRMGLADLVASSTEDYVALAVRLASDGEYRSSVRRRIVAARHMLFEDEEPIRALEHFLAAAGARRR